ncbi:MFS transporter [Clostridium gasigenes]|uniref:MFS transporter n=1 Tax=Clostridium gasigenes TaxID=94869 RepID=UPI00162816DB|nr:MFS transporter [Clostridium gasigenes]MBB6622359.1 MFS transporter [Clostridium gasigenes]
MKFTYKHTLYASYLGYITQAIINNLAPLLFLTFQKEFDISLESIGILIALNFGIQIITDILAAKFIDKIGYRISIVGAHILCLIGLVSMGILPYLFTNAYVGLVIAISINAVGGGLIEVLISPIVQALPGDEKESAMNMLHSFYCWGHVIVVLLTTIYFNVAGTENWIYLPMIWGIVPLFNMVLFLKVPLRILVEEEVRIPFKKLFAAQIFWMFIILMICAGASEQAMAQWASLFAESGLGVSKSMGNLLGTCAFAILMGTARVFYGIKGSKINMKKALVFSSILCVLSYLLAVFSTIPLVSLIGCALCGLSVGIMWPGVFSLSAKYYPKGGTVMFAVLALAGDVGCSAGPGLVGFVSNSVEKGKMIFSNSWFYSTNITEIGLKTGLLFVIIFPVIMLFSIISLNKKNVQISDSIPDIEKNLSN